MAILEQVPPLELLLLEELELLLEDELDELLELEELLLDDDPVST